MRLWTRLLLGALVLAAAAGILDRAPGPAAALVLVAAILQARPGLFPDSGRVVTGALATLFLAVAILARGPWILLLLPAALRSLRRPRPARGLRTARDAMILSVGLLAFSGNPAALAGAVASTLLLVFLLPRLNAERMAALDGRAPSASPGTAWTLPAVAVASALLFFLLPIGLTWSGEDGGRDRSSLGSRRPRGTGKETGSADGGPATIVTARRVSIGDIGRLQRDLRPILEISVLRGGRPATAEDLGPLFRSGALEEFDGTTWESRPGRSVPVAGGPDGFHQLPRRRLPEGEFLEQHLHFLTGGSDALFCLGMPTAVGGEGAREGVLLAPRGEVRAAREYPEGARYAIRSVAVPGEYAAVDDEDLSGPRRARLTAVPPGHDRAAVLARGELGISPGLDGRALLRRLEAFLGKRCRYSLDIAPTGDATPVEAFLFDSRRGHCELFASAAAVMLRSLGVPARVVVGFRGGLLDEGAKRYTLRGADAHAWTEAWFEEIGWVTFDPTPGSEARRPDATGTAAGEEESAAPRAGILDRILGLDAADRRAMLGRGASAVGRIAAQTFFEVDGSLRIPTVLLLLGAAALLVASRFLRGRAASLPAPVPGAPPAIPIPEAWALLLARLSERGLRRAPSETGLEFAGRAVAAGVGPRAAIDRLAAAYASERFGTAAPSDAERSELRTLAASLSVR